MLWGQTNVGVFQRIDLLALDSMRGAALVADQFLNDQLQLPLQLVVAGFGSASGYQLQKLSQGKNP